MANSMQNKNYKIIADLHCHTLASTHAFSTVTEIFEQAALIGLKAVAITDHAVAIPDSPHEWHFSCQQFLPPTYKGVHVLRGAEVNVLDTDGNIDLSEYTLSTLQVVVASMHTPVLPDKLTVEESTNAWLNVADNPYVSIIGHSGIPQYAYEYERVIKVFKEKGKIVEINEGSFFSRSTSIPNCITIAKLCKKHDVPIAVSTDSHYHLNLGKTPKSFQFLAEIDFPQELIVNGSVANMNKYFGDKGVHIE